MNKVPANAAQVLAYQPCQQLLSSEICTPQAAVQAKAATPALDIDVAGLYKTFGGHNSTTEVLRDIHFSIPSGQAVALIGHNGSG